MTEDKLAGCAVPGPSLEMDVAPGAAQIMDCLAGAVGLARVSPVKDVRRVYIPKSGASPWTEDDE